MNCNKRIRLGDDVTIVFNASNVVLKTESEKGYNIDYLDLTELDDLKKFINTVSKHLAEQEQKQ